MMYAREHPDRIRALALIDSGGPTLQVCRNSPPTEARFSRGEARIKEWSDPEKKEHHKRAVLSHQSKDGRLLADRRKPAVPSTR
jgi:pimeloyl-ACP methyl ester carboxylesterase